MPTLTQVRSAVATTLSAAITGLNTYPRVPASVVEPAVVVLPAEADYLVTMNNAATGWELDLVVVGGTNEETAQDALDEMIDGRGARSIKAAIHATPQLGRTDVSAVVRRMTNYGARYQFAGAEYVCATLRLYVLATHA